MIKVFRMPSLEPAITGKAQLAEVYRKRFSALASDLIQTVWFFYPSEPFPLPSGT